MGHKDVLDKSWGEIKQAVILVNPKHRDVLDELEKQCLAVKASETPPAPVPLAPAEYGAMGGRGKKADSTNKNRNGLNPKGGTNSAYRLSVLKRNCPEVAKRVEAGEFKTVADAERAANAKAAEVELAMKQVDPEAEEFVKPGGANNPLGLGGKTGKTLDDDIVNPRITRIDQNTSKTHHDDKPGILRRIARAAEVELAMKQVDPESEAFVGPGAPKGNQNAVRDKDETIGSNATSCTPPDEMSRKSNSERHSKPGILRRLARAASGQKSRGVVPSPERQAQCQELLRRYKDGELSAHQAAIAAGLRKVKSPLDAALAAYRRLSPEDREKFMELVASWRE